MWIRRKRSSFSGGQLCGWIWGAKSSQFLKFGMNAAKVGDGVSRTKFCDIFLQIQMCLIIPPKTCIKSITIQGALQTNIVFLFSMHQKKRLLKSLLLPSNLPSTSSAIKTAILVKHRRTWYDTGRIKKRQVFKYRLDVH